MSADRIPVGPHTAKLMQKLAEEGAASPNFTFEEKLALVADNLMDPKEVGCTSAEEAALQIKPEDKPKPEFGNEAVVQLGVIPIELRAEWAFQETKLTLSPRNRTEWIQDWIKNHSNDYRVRVKVQCGNVVGMFERSFTDPILGMAAMLQIAAEQLEAAYTGKPPCATTDQPQLEDSPPQLQIEDAKAEEKDAKTED